MPGASDVEAADEPKQAPEGNAARKAVFVLASQVAGSGLGFLVLLAIGRYYAPAAYGSYLFAVSLLGLVATTFRLGYDQAHTHLIAKGIDPAKALGVYLRIRTRLILLMVTLVLLALATWTQVLGRSFTDATSLQVIAVIFVGSILSQIRHAGDAHWLGQRRVHRVEWCNFVDTLAFATGVIGLGLAVAHASGRWTPLPGLSALAADVLGITQRPRVAELALYLAYAHLAGKVAAAGLNAIWWMREKAHVGPWDPETAKAYTRFALPVAFTGVLAVVLQHTDVLMLGYFWTSREVGLYGAAQKLSSLAVLGSMALRPVLFPHFSGLLGRGDKEAAMRAFKRAERYLLLFVLPFAIPMVAVARPLLHIAVGDGFLSAAPALRWLALWAVVMALNMPLRAKHMGAGDTRTVLRAVILNVSVNVALNLVLIPRSLLGIPLAGMGAEGAAIATFSSTLAAYMYNRWSARDSFTLPLFDGVQVRMLAAAAVAVAGLLWFKAVAPLGAYNRFWELGGLVVGSWLVYLVLLVALRQLGRDDIRFLARAMRPLGLMDEARGR